jgi:hypothetical protein
MCASPHSSRGRVGGMFNAPHEEHAMKRLSTLACALVMGLALNAHAADAAPDVIYGSELMTAQERHEYHVKMRSLKTAEERDAFRLEHHKQMQERAAAQGKTLPEVPPMGKGRGAGMGPGGGMGPGYRR